MFMFGTRDGGSFLFRSRSVWVNTLVLLITLAFITFNTWGTLHYALKQQDGDQKALDASYSSPIPVARQLSPYGLFVPEGPATALPSVRTTADEEASIKSRSFYGGKGDKAHLGGFTAFDYQGVSPTLWKHMVGHLGIKTILDVGCGRGISTSWFILHGLEYVACAEGSHDAVTQSLLPTLKNIPNGTKYELIEHDFSRGPWWPSRTVDAVWCVEFVEHVGRNYQPNYLMAWRKAGIIFMTHSRWGGWHHVEVHDSDWWIVRMEGMGFVYSDILTQQMRKKAKLDRSRQDLVPDSMKQPNKRISDLAQHLWGSLLVFINPLVTSRYEHAHLFAEHGCNSPTKGRPQECGKEGLGDGVSELTPLPDSFKPLNMTEEMDDQWLGIIKGL